MHKVHSVAIIGVGPKGLYCLERLLAEIKAKPLEEPLEIHLINKGAEFGTSPVYSIHQPEYILVNIGVGEVNTWATRQPEPIVEDPKNFVNWYNDKFTPEDPIIGDEYLSRAVIGKYLHEGFQQLCSSVPDGVKLHSHTGEATNIDKCSSGYTVEISNIEKGIEEIKAEKILFATGHAIPSLDNESLRCQEFAGRHSNAKFIPFVYPVIQALQGIQKDDIVAIKGIGLTFIDALVELTEGRGGEFKRTAEGKLIYQPSGNEPSKILPFSRQGIPVIPKSRHLPIELRKLSFFTLKNIERTQKVNIGEQGNIDFDADLKHLFVLEMKLAFYEVASKGTEWHEKFKKVNGEQKTLLNLIDEFLTANPEQSKMDFEAMTNPIRKREFTSGEEYTSFIQEYLEKEIHRAFRGQLNSPTKAALEVWFEIRLVIAEIMQFGGLSPQSHRSLKGGLFAKMKRVVFGPPIVNIEKIVALIDAQIIDFSIAMNPEILLDETMGEFDFNASNISKEHKKATVLIDARYPDIGLNKDTSPLMQNLLKKGSIRLFENKSTENNGSSYFPGAIDMTYKFQNLIEKGGTINTDFSVIGIPTEHNLLGNLTCVPGDFPSIWAKQIAEQLRQKELGNLSSITHQEKSRNSLN